MKEKLCSPESLINTNSNMLKRNEKEKILEISPVQKNKNICINESFVDESSLESR